MKNQIKNKNLVFPWDIKGYIQLSNKAKSEIIEFLINKHRFKSKIANTLDVPVYWFYNFKKSDKIDTFTFKKIINLTKNKNLIKEITQFNDDKGSSSIHFKGKFPIHYDPLWHFIFCLSIGDGHIHKGNKKRFSWYQKPEGLKRLVKLICRLGFKYSPPISTCKKGIVIPQMIRKVGEHVTGLSLGYEITKNIIDVSSRLGEDYEIALISAFVLDESGMATLKNNSEMTIHQEGNLDFLENFGDLLNKFRIDWSKNKKGEKWNIRLNTNGIIKLAELFESIKKYDITLLHRQKIFQKKVKIAKKTNYKSPLKLESKNLHDYLLNNYSGKTLTLKQIRNYYKSNHNIQSRSLKLIEDMKKKGELIKIGFSKYLIRRE